jgi:hypothetical protein
MKKVVERERNKTYYRVLHAPIWIWVFFVLPGHLTCALFTSGPDRRHGLWLAAVTAVVAWRGLAGRLPGVEPRPYITHYGVAQPNLLYRRVCYTAAWIDLLVPHTLNALGLVVAAVTGRWMLAQLFAWLYYPFAAVIVLASLLDITPRARSTTLQEGAERAWFYVAIWTIVPAQVVAWAAWRLGFYMGLAPLPLARLRVAAFAAVTAALLGLALAGRLPRTARFYVPEPASEADPAPARGASAAD